MGSTRRRSRGFTLVSLMVGLLISMLVVLAMLSLYRVVARSVFGSGGLVRNAKQDGALASGLMSAQVALQDAGFGIKDASVGQEVVALTAASFDPASGRLRGTAQSIGSVAATVDAIAWESNPSLAADSGTWPCSALVSGLGAGGQPALYLLQATGPCHPVATRFGELEWKHGQLIPENAIPSQVGLTALGGASCWPFGAVPKTISGLAPASGALQLTLTYRNSTTGTASEAAERSLAVCMSNFKSS